MSSFYSKFMGPTLFKFTILQSLKLDGGNKRQGKPRTAWIILLLWSESVEQCLV